MSNNNRIQKLETAQILPFVVLTLFVLIAFSALLLDGGMLMSNRRTAQAAADSGALAGARLLCGQDTAAKRTAARAAAIDYVQRNNALPEEPTFTVNSKGVVEINVETSVTNNAFFAGVFGEPDLTAAAEATAACYYPSVVNRILPIAFYYESPPLKASETDCTDLSKPCSIVNWDYEELLTLLDQSTAVDLPHDGIYVIAETTKVCEKYVTGEIVCAEMKDNASGGNRVWINLSQVADTNNLKKVINDGFDSPLDLPAWLNGDPGTVSAVYSGSLFASLDKIPDYPDLDARLVGVPVFDQYCASQPFWNCAVAGDNDYLHNANQPSYRLVGVAPFIVTCVTKNAKCEFGQCIPANTGNNTTNKPICPGFFEAEGTANKSAIEGYFVDGVPADQYTAGIEGVDVGQIIITLSK